MAKAVLNGSWEEWSKFVLLKLEEISQSQKKVDARLDNFSIEVAQLKVKSGIWGLIGGAITVILALLIFFFKEMMSK